MVTAVRCIILSLLSGFPVVISQRFPVNSSTVPLHFFDFGPDAGDNIAPQNDDGSTGEIPIAVALPFYNNFHRVVYISTNGAMSFLRDVRSYTPVPFPISGDRRMIAPFWTDVDTRRNGGRVYYREYYGRDSETLNVRRKVWMTVQDAFPGAAYIPDWVMVVTWYRVDCFGGCSSENTFQLVVSTDGIKSYVSFHYGTMTWFRGSASSVPALVGFNAGDGINFEMLNESRTEDIINVQNTSNVGVPGLRVYRIDGETIQSTGCRDDFSGFLEVNPRYGSMLGGKRVRISGPCFNNTNIIRCRFGDTVVDGRVADDRTVECVAPYTGIATTTSFTLSLDGGINYLYRGNFVYVEYDPTKEVERLQGPGRSTENGTSIVRWNPDHLSETHVNISFIMFKYDNNRSLIRTETLIASNVPNPQNGVGDLAVFIITDLEEDILSFPSICAIRIGSATSSDTEFLWSDIHYPEWYLHHFFTYVVSSNLNDGKRRKRSISEDVQQVWNEIGGFFNDVEKDITDIKKNVEQKFSNIREAYFGFSCNVWVALEQAFPPDFSGVAPPPCTLDQALNDPNFVTDTACNMGRGCQFHKPDAFHCVRSRIPSPSGSSQQACYSESGELLTFSRGGGTVDRSGINIWFTVGGVAIPTPTSGLFHLVDDVLSYWDCCAFSNNCDKYERQRPTHDCSDYVPPGSGAGMGDPHVFTLDNFQYTFNGRGEYVLLQVPLVGLMVQARTSQAVNGTGYKLEATEWSAMAMKMAGTSVVEVQVNDIMGLNVIVDGTSQEFDNVVEKIDFMGGSVTKTRLVDNSTQCVVDFPLVSFRIYSESTTRLSFVVLLPDNLKGNTSGLLGVWNGDATDDLKAFNGTMLDPSSSQETIFYSFGETWRIDETKSLFTYDSLRAYSHYNNRSFVPLFLTDEDLNSPDAVAFCGSNKQCLNDFVLTNGDETFAMKTMKTVETVHTILENIQPVVTCGFPRSPANANISGNGSLVGAVVDFTCHDGYYLTGESRIVCQSNGTWSAEPPACVVVCQPPVIPQNTSATANGSLLGAVVDFSCHEGFSLLGVARIICQENGQWSAEPPLCEITCLPQITPSNANAVNNGSLVGAVVDFTCRDGYNLTGESRIVCQSNGTWSAEPPACELTEGGGDGGKKGILWITGSIGAVMFITMLAISVYVCSYRRIHMKRQAKHEDYNPSYSHDSDPYSHVYQDLNRSLVANTRRPAFSRAEMGPHFQYSNYPY